MCYPQEEVITLVLFRQSCSSGDLGVEIIEELCILQEQKFKSGYGINTRTLQLYNADVSKLQHILQADVDIVIMDVAISFKLPSGIAKFLASLKPGARVATFGRLDEEWNDKRDGVFPFREFAFDDTYATSWTKNHHFHLWRKIESYRKQGERNQAKIFLENDDEVKLKLSEQDQTHERTTKVLEEPDDTLKKHKERETKTRARGLRQRLLNLLGCAAKEN